MEGVFASLRQDWQALRATIRGIRPESWLVLGLCALLLGLWIGLAARSSAAMFPSPGETGEALFWMLMDTRRDYPRAIGDTVSVYLSGLGIAVALAWALAFGMKLVPLLGRAFSPFLDVLASIPNIALMPFFVALLGLGFAAKLVVVALAALLPIAISAHAALRQIPAEYEEAAIALGATRFGALRQVLWRMALPQMLAGVRIGAAQGLVAAIVAEMYTAMTGMGGLLAGYGGAFNMPRYFVVVLTLAALGILTSALLRRLQERAARRAGIEAGPERQSLRRPGNRIEQERPEP